MTCRLPMTRPHPRQPPRRANHPAPSMTSTTCGWTPTTSPPRRPATTVPAAPRAGAAGRPRHRPRLDTPRRGRRLARKADQKALALTPEQRLLLLDTWQRCGLPAADFAALVGLSKYTLYEWKR